LDANVGHLLIDVRPKVQTDMSKVDHAIAIALDQLIKGDGVEIINDLLKKQDIKNVYVMCRRGNASQKAVRFLKDNIDRLDKDVEIKDIIGGIEAWSAEVDPSVPLY